MSMNGHLKKGIAVVALLLCSNFAHPNNLPLPKAVQKHRAVVHTLPQAFLMVLRTNPKMLESEANKSSSWYNYRQQRSSYYPQISVGYGIGYDRSSVNDPYVNQTAQSRSLTASQLVFDGGKTINQVASARAEYEESEKTTEQDANDLAISTVEAYLTVLQDRQLLKISFNNMESHAKTEAGIARRYKGGVSRRSEFELALSRFEEAKSNYYTSERDLDVANDNYIKVIGVPTEKQLDSPGFPQHFLPATLEAAIKIANINNPAIKAAEKKRDAAYFAYKQAKAQLYSPQVSIDATANRDRNLSGFQGLDVDMQGLLSVSYNLFDGGSDLASMRKAAADKVSSEENLANLRRAVAEQVREAWDDMLASEKRDVSLHKRIVSSAIVLKGFRYQFLLGQVSLLDLMTQENNDYTGQINYVQNQYRLLLDKYQVVSSMGILPDVLKHMAMGKY